jgi:hypothetical protein
MATFRQDVPSTSTVYLHITQPAVLSRCLDDEGNRYRWVTLVLVVQLRTTIFPLFMRLNVIQDLALARIITSQHISVRSPVSNTILRLTLRLDTEPTLFLRHSPRSSQSLRLYTISPDYLPLHFLSNTPPLNVRYLHGLLPPTLHAMRSPCPLIPRHT